MRISTLLFTVRTKAISPILWIIYIIFIRIFLAKFNLFISFKFLFVHILKIGKLRIFPFWACIKVIFLGHILLKHLELTSKHDHGNGIANITFLIYRLSTILQSIVCAIDHHPKCWISEICQLSLWIQSFQFTFWLKNSILIFYYAGFIQFISLLLVGFEEVLFVFLVYC